jgi:hypothetical protein
VPLRAVGGSSGAAQGGAELAGWGQLLRAADKGATPGGRGTGLMSVNTTDKSVQLPHPVQIAQTVGVYYASNAVGRLVGTLASGAPARLLGVTCCR